jgi:pSer/pThr/pTyr-binding forkhead associated (FHA) protein/ribosomal protein L40E
MIVCPNCKHDNPEGATNCEACYTALPATKACPNCGASIQLDATFCGQCGHNLKPAESKSPILLPPPATASSNSAPEIPSVGLPATVLTSQEVNLPTISSDPVVSPAVGATPPIAIEPDVTIPPAEAATVTSAPPLEEPAPAAISIETSVETVATPVSKQLQVVACQLLHLQTNTVLEIPPQLQVVHLGKPNDVVFPDIDVSSFPCAEVVSRVHANIRLEGENYYVEDVGSANGTYINHNILAKGNRHLLRSGDRIGLGKGDLVTLIFQTST